MLIGTFRGFRLSWEFRFISDMRVLHLPTDLYQLSFRALYIYTLFYCFFYQHFHFFACSPSISFIPSTIAATKCEQLSSQASANGLVGAYVPQRNEDGSFKAEQCWGSTGYCWCVDEYGKEIPGTKIRGKPDCSKKGNWLILRSSRKLLISFTNLFAAWLFSS